MLPIGGSEVEYDVSQAVGQCNASRLKFGAIQISNHNGNCCDDHVICNKI